LESNKKQAVEKKIYAAEWQRVGNNHQKDKLIKVQLVQSIMHQSCTYHSVLCQSCNENIHRDAINRAVRLQNHTIQMLPHSCKGTIQR